MKFLFIRYGFSVFVLSSILAGLLTGYLVADGHLGFVRAFLGVPCLIVFAAALGVGAYSLRGAAPRAINLAVVCRSASEAFISGALVTLALPSFLDSTQDVGLAGVASVLAYSLTGMWAWSSCAISVYTSLGLYFARKPESQWSDMLYVRLYLWPFTKLDSWDDP